MNNKGVTLVELILSFALVSVTVIYFFQTIITVKKMYITVKNDTDDFINKAYAIKITDTILTNSYDLITNNINAIGFDDTTSTNWNEITDVNLINGINDNLHSLCDTSDNSYCSGTIKLFVKKYDANGVDGYMLKVGLNNVVFYKNISTR